MFRRRQGPARREPHPDPATELRLQQIAGLARLRSECHQMLAVYRHAIVTSNAILDEALKEAHLGGSYCAAAERAEGVTPGRIARAEEGIVTQQNRAEELSQKIIKAAGELGLNENDLAYLPSLDL